MSPDNPAQLIPNNPVAMPYQTPPDKTSGALEATEVIRQKLDRIFAQEPDAKKDEQEVLALARPRSKHQNFMFDLSVSDKSDHEIQVAWHLYYTGLPDDEKHEVWREFNESKPLLSTPATLQTRHVPAQRREAFVPKPAIHAVTEDDTMPKRTRSMSDIKQHLKATIQSGQKLDKRQHFKSLMFGFAMASTVLAVTLFGFFNERFIAPFISPSRNVSSTPIIISSSTGTTNDQGAKVIVPKINIEIPVIYDVASIGEIDIQRGLENGVVHYPTTPNPGEVGNVVMFGHSSSNIFNNGKYKFAFTLLNKTEVGDNFYLSKDGKRFVYKIYEKKIVRPTEVAVLGPASRPSTATLITCDPPGTSTNRLIVIGEQISPDPDTNGRSTALKADTAPSIVPSNAPSLWHRIFGT